MSSRLIVVLQDKKLGIRSTVEYKIEHAANVRKILKSIRKSTGAKIVKYTLVS